MFRRIFAIVLLAGLLCPGQVSPGSPAPVPNDTAKGSVDWTTDSVCQLVFFAVLEGLYTDGVATETVDAILAVDPKTKQPRFEEHFVSCCPLCQPAYEALVLYRFRPDFSGRKESKNSFGTGLEPDLEATLHSKTKADRMTAIQTLVDSWVRRRLASMALTKEQRTEMTRQLEIRRNQGMAMLKKIQAGGQHGDWKVCAFCEGALCGSK